MVSLPGWYDAWKMQSSEDYLDDCVVYRCAECNGGIYEDETYYRIGDEKYCKDCMDSRFAHTA